MEWRTNLPQLHGRTITLREPAAIDAPSLLSLLSTEQVARFISRPPSTLEGFERFIAWAQQQRATGQYICFAIVPNGSEEPLGLVHIRALGLGFGTADWGMAIASEFLGSGVFTETAELLLDFAFNVLRTHRLEARAAICNGRGNGAMKKLGAQREGVLRHSFFRDGDYLDQVVWSILGEEWLARRNTTGRTQQSWASTAVH